MLILDRFGLFVTAVCALGGVFSALSSPSFLRQHKMEFGEFYALILFSVAGMSMLAMASDLVSLFIGIETMSLGVYVLTGSWRRAPRSSEAAMKYFLMGAFVSAILIYGMALIYGTSGTTEYALIQNRLGSLSGQPLFYVGLFFLLGGFAFKVGAVPFHMWAPDTYEGAPTPVSGFMMASVKAAAFAGLMRVVFSALRHPDVSVGPTGWVQVLYVLSAVTMTLGNIAALRQENIKRLLAYSSIAHAGYLLLGVVALGVVGDEARGPLLYYILAYALTTVGSMGVVAWVGLGGGVGEERLNLSQWAGLAKRRPAAALAMTIFLLSLGGFPPTAGFFGKFYVFRAALMKPQLLPLVLLAVVNSVISVYYYLRVITAMYFREAKEEEPAVSGPHGGSLAFSVLFAAVLVLAIGLVPVWFAEIAASATLG
jgi:NADH-quinone oxidoreductase subunit N